jgi:DNA-binding Lrp family transcriptional regulator
MFRFRDRGVLDERSERFLMTVAWLGGYVTAEQAQELGIRNSVPRVHVRLKDLESWGFIKRISTYPAVYQVTKSVTGCWELTCLRGVSTPLRPFKPGC